MNFIAHFHLSFFKPNFVVGNYLADMITPNEFKLLPAEPHEGVLFHRFIDHFTDHHEVVSEMKKMFYQSHGKYSPVLVDIFMDISLYKNWNLYSELKFEDFCTKIYSILNENIIWIPQRLKDILVKMIEDDWLKEYIDYEGLGRTFLRIAAIARFSGNFAEAVNTYHNNHKEFDKLFTVFYPDLVEVCHNYQPSK